jgi:hypothetical protein
VRDAEIRLSGPRFVLPCQLIENHAQKYALTESEASDLAAAAARLGSGFNPNWGRSGGFSS